MAKDIKKHTDRIKTRLISGHKVTDVTRHAFLGYHPAIVCSGYDFVFEIQDQVAKHFSIPFSSVKVVGSGQLGESLIKGHDFKRKISDLDIAVINSQLFLKFKEEVFFKTNSFQLGHLFKDDAAKSQYKRNLEKGFINPLSAPASCPLRASWFNFFGKLSKKYSADFKSVSGGLYESEFFFISKQTEIIDKLTIGY